MVLTAPERAEIVNVVRVTPNFFDVMGLGPLIGRAIGPDDGRPDAPPVAVLRHRAWVSHFGGDSGVLGRTIRLNGEPRTIVGVMPPRFTWHAADVWIPAPLNRSAPETPADQRNFQARLKPGVTLPAGRSTAQRHCHAARASAPGGVSQELSYPGRKRHRVGRGGFSRSALHGVGSRCAAHADRLLQRGQHAPGQGHRSRAGDDGPRRARSEQGPHPPPVGGRESSAVSWRGRRRLPARVCRHQGARSVSSARSPARRSRVRSRWSRRSRPASESPSLSALLFGIAPALYGARRDLVHGLNSSGRSPCRRAGPAQERSGRRRNRALAGTAARRRLLMRSFLSLVRVDLGFDPRNILVMSVAFAPGEYADPADRHRFYDQLLQRIASLPGVEAATASTGIPRVQRRVYQRRSRSQGTLQTDPFDSARSVLH